MWHVWWAEFKHKRLSLIVYCLSAMALVALYVAVFPSIKASAAQFEQVLKAYPKEILQAFGIEGLAFNTLEKYLAAEQYSFVWPVLAISLALSRAGGSLAGEIERGTMGLLLALPLRRLQVWTAKYLAGLATVAVFATVSVLSVIPIAATGDFHANVPIALRTWLLAGLFIWAVFALGMALSAIFSERSKVYATASGLLLMMYVLNVVAAVKDSLDKLKYFSYFHYFNLQPILGGQAVNSASLWFFAAVITAATIFSAWRFIQRDLAV